MAGKETRESQEARALGYDPMIRDAVGGIDADAGGSTQIQWGHPQVGGEGAGCRIQITRNRESDGYPSEGLPVRILQLGSRPRTVQASCAI